LKLLQRIPCEAVIQALDRKLLTKGKPVSAKCLPKIQISFKHGAVFLNEVKIIGKESENLHKIFRIFLDQFLNDAIHGEACSDFKLVNIHEIAELSENAGLTPLDTEKQVRRQINRLQKIINDKFSLRITESVSWTGTD
jgi:hypothetical protein